MVAFQRPYGQKMDRVGVGLLTYQYSSTKYEIYMYMIFDKYDSVEKNWKIPLDYKKGHDRLERS